MNTLPVKNQLRPPLMVDTIMMMITLAMIIFSLIMIYSTTGILSTEKYGEPWFFVKRQAVAVVLGLVLLALASRIQLNYLKLLSPYFYFLIFPLLLSIYIPFISHSSGGAQRWLNLGLIKFQPVELVKVLFVVFMAGYLTRKKELLGRFSYGVVMPLFFSSSVAAVLLLQPDFGSSAIITLVTLGMTMAAGVRLRHILLSLVPVVVAAVALIIHSPYRLKRIVAFLSPEADALGKGYQLTQSLIAVGSGQFGGVGLGASQQKLFFLPAAHTDFLFAVIAEELGFIGCLAVITVIMFFLWRGLKIAQKVVADSFAYNLAVGMTLLLVIPALLNIGVVTGILPTKGMVLPLLGYGGSSMICSLFAVGFILCAARHRYRHAL